MYFCKFNITSTIEILLLFFKVYIKINILGSKFLFESFLFIKDFNKSIKSFDKIKADLRFSFLRFEARIMLLWWSLCLLVNYTSYMGKLVNISIIHSFVTLSPETGHVIILVGTSCFLHMPDIPAGLVVPRNYKYDVTHRVEGSLQLRI